MGVYIICSLNVVLKESVDMGNQMGYHCMKKKNNLNEDKRKDKSQRELSEP